MNTKSRIKLETLVAVFLVAALVLPTIALQAWELPKSGDDKAMVKPVPWSGYWFSRQQLGMVKVLEKYDSFVQAKTGSNPGAKDWEANPRNNHYGPNQPSWAGHCNGWAAAAILEPEPTKPRKVDGITFSVGDQKALLTELYMSCSCQFYGKRKNDNFPISLDIRPDIFHRLLLDNIKEKNRAMVADITFNSPVWNYPIYGYETEWKKSWLVPHQINVTTTVYFADDGVQADYLGTKTFTKTYRYNLYTNGKGEIVFGTWALASQFDHPDFIWIPIAATPAEYGENPKIAANFIHQIVGRAGTESPAAPETMRTTPGIEFDIMPVSEIPAAPESVLSEAGLNPEEILH